MQILYSPQLNDQVITYTFGIDVITAELGGVSDTFDFSSFGDGELDVSFITTTLPVNPIRSAKRVSGILYVELLNYIGHDATEVERFPVWETK